MWHQIPYQPFLDNTVKERGHNFLIAGHIDKCWSQMEMTASHVYKYTWENPLRSLPGFPIFVWSGQQDPARPGEESGPKPRDHTKQLADISPHPLLSQLATQKQREVALLKTKDKTQNMKWQLFSLALSPATQSGKVLLSFPPEHL